MSSTKLLFIILLSPLLMACAVYSTTRYDGSPMIVAESYYGTNKNLTEFQKGRYYGCMERLESIERFRTDSSRTRKYASREDMINASCFDEVYGPWQARSDYRGYDEYYYERGY